MLKSQRPIAAQRLAEVQNTANKFQALLINNFNLLGKIIKVLEN